MSCDDRWEIRTLRAGKDAAIRALLECLVELRRENSVGDTAEVVVRLHVFLEGLAAVDDTIESAMRPSKLCRRLLKRVRRRRRRCDEY